MSEVHYRTGRALLLLERDLDVCARACERVPDDVGFRTLSTRAEKKRKELRGKEERRERARRVREEKERMDAAFAVHSPPYTLPSSLSEF